MNATDAWLPTILRDFRGTPAETAGVRLLELDPDQPDEHSEVITDPSAWLDRDDPTRHQMLMTINENVTSLDAEDTSDLAVEIASRLQDLVMDETNKPWPEMVVDGHSVVLEPGLGPDGQPRWEGNDGTYCAFGELGDQLAAGHS